MEPPQAEALVLRGPWPKASDGNRNSQYTWPYQCRLCVSTRAGGARDRVGSVANVGREVSVHGDRNLTIEPRAVEALRERAHCRDVNGGPVTFRQTFGNEPRENERHRLARRSHELTQQLVLGTPERNAPVVRGEHSRACELDERRDQSLFDAEGRKLAKPLEEGGAFLDHLPDQDERLLRYLAEKFSEYGTAEVQCV